MRRLLLFSLLALTIFAAKTDNSFGQNAYDRAACRGLGVRTDLPGAPAKATDGGPRGNYPNLGVNTNPLGRQDRPKTPDKKSTLGNEPVSDASGSDRSKTDTQICTNAGPAGYCISKNGVMSVTGQGGYVCVSAATDFKEPTTFCIALCSKGGVGFVGSGSVGGCIDTRGTVSTSVSAGAGYGLAIGPANFATKSHEVVTQREQFNIPETVNNLLINPGQKRRKSATTSGMAIGMPPGKD